MHGVTMKSIKMIVIMLKYALSWKSTDGFGRILVFFFPIECYVTIFLRIYHSVKKKSSSTPVTESSTC